MKPPFQQQAGVRTQQVYAFMALLLAGVWLHIGYQRLVGGRRGAALAVAPAELIDALHEALAAKEAGR